MMTKSRYDPQRHHRRSIRLKGYDYTQAGAYYVTIVCQHRLCLLEPVPVRAMIQTWWDKLPDKFPTIETDAFVIMPNHIHGIIVVTGQGQTRGSAPNPNANAGRTHVFAPNPHWAVSCNGSKP